MLPVGKTNGAGEAACFSSSGRQDHVVGIDAIELLQQCAESRAPLALLPSVEVGAKRFARGGADIEIQQAEGSQVEHDFGHAAGKEDPNRGVTDGTVWERIDEARRGAVDFGPISDRSDAGVRRRVRWREYGGGDL
jgi:hypothetical protein